MKTVGLPAILARMLAQQAELAALLRDHRVHDDLQRLRLAEAAAQNARDFQAFVATHSIEVRRRPCAPQGTEKVRPHCAKCANRCVR